MIYGNNILSFWGARIILHYKLKMKEAGGSAHQNMQKRIIWSKMCRYNGLDGDIWAQC